MQVQNMPWVGDTWVQPWTRINTAPKWSEQCIDEVNGFLKLEWITFGPFLLRSGNRRSFKPLESIVCQQSYFPSFL